MYGAVNIILLDIQCALCALLQRDSLSESDSDSSSTTGGSASKSDMPVAKSRNASRRARREAVRNARKALQNPNEHHSVMVTQMDAETLRRQGYKVRGGGGGGA